MRNILILTLIILISSCTKSGVVPIIPEPEVAVVPNSPTDLKGIIFSPTQIDLTWKDASNNEDGFKIERKSTTEAYSIIATLSQNVVSYSDKGFPAGPLYTYRVYAYNTKGNSNYSNEISQLTTGLATITTSPISDTTAITAISGGNITNDGGGQIYERGIVWSTLPNPTVSLNTKTTDGTGPGLFNSIIKGLEKNTKYYVRSYATNVAGTAYGNELFFVTNNIDILNGQIAYYPFNGNANDSSAYANNGTVKGAILTTDRFGNPNKAYDLNGSSYIVVQDATQLNFGTSSFSISCWALCTGLNRWQHILTKGDVPYPSKEFYLRYENELLDFSFGTADIKANTYCISQITNKQNWHNIFVNYNTVTLTTSLYFDGKLIKEANINVNSANTSGPMYFGAENPVITLPSGPQYFTGKIDDIRIYNRVLNPGEIDYLSKN